MVERAGLRKTAEMIPLYGRVQKVGNIKIMQCNIFILKRLRTIGHNKIGVCENSFKNREL